MIVRINQIDVAAAESATGWDPGPPRGGVDFTWPLRTFAYQIFILDVDERQQPLPGAFRQNQLRQLIPQVLSALAGDETQETVVRLDGPVIDGELLAAFGYAADPTGCERYAISATHKLDPLPDAVLSSVRLVPTPALLKTMCGDAQLGLDRSVRLRAFAVPEPMVNPLLDTTDLDDERWREVLPRATMVLSTAVNLQSLVVWTPRFDPAEAKRRIMQRLAGR
jgi:hypothetical protein